MRQALQIAMCNVAVATVPITSSGRGELTIIAPPTSINREVRGSHLHWYMCSLKSRNTCIREHVVVPHYMTTLDYPIHPSHACKNLL